MWYCGIYTFALMINRDGSWRPGHKNKFFPYMENEDTFDPQIKMQIARLIIKIQLAKECNDDPSLSLALLGLVT